MRSLCGGQNRGKGEAGLGPRECQHLEEEATAKETEKKQK